MPEPLLSLNKREKPRILWHSVSGHIGSGYGNTTRNICGRLVQRGYEVIVSAYYGLDPGGSVFINGVLHFPSKVGKFGEISCKQLVARLKPDMCFLNCYDDKTEILTRTGWKRGIELTGDEEIATLDEEGYIKYRKPKSIFKTEYKGPMYHLENRKISLKVTPHHKVYVKKRTWKDYRLVPVEEIVGKRVQFKKNAKWKGKDCSIIQIPERTGDTESLTEYDTMKLMRLLGMYFSEGHVQNDSIVISQYKEKSKEIFRRTLEEDGWNFKETKTGFVIKDPTLAHYLKNFGKTLDKHLPPFIFELAPKYLKELWKYLVLGDGWTTKSGTEIYCSSSKRLIDELQEILLKMGYSGDIRINAPERDYNIMGKTYHCQTNFSISKNLKNNPRTIPDMKSEKRWTYYENWEYYEGIVWCPSMENVPVYVRRNGKAFWCGRTDWWAFPWFPKLPSVTVCHSPMDHENYPEELLNLTRSYDYVCSYSRWQQRRLKENGIESYYTPHGVDTEIFKPRDKLESRRKLGFPEDKFIILRVAANSDKEDRKSHGRCFKAIRLFFEDNPDARKDVYIYCHTNPRDPRGMPLHLMAHKQGLDNNVFFMSEHLHNARLSTEEMSYLYSAGDVLLNPSTREGFGLPILEALACGRPVIVTDFSSMTELGKDHGWLVRNLLDKENLITTPLNADSSLPDVYSIKDAIEDAYNHPKKCEMYGKKGREFAMDYDWNRIIEKQWIPMLEEILENMPQKPQDIFGISERKEEQFRKKFEEAIK